jgi:hypothetical protein
MKNDRDLPTRVKEPCSCCGTTKKTGLCCVCDEYFCADCIEQQHTVLEVAKALESLAARGLAEVLIDSNGDRRYHIKPGGIAMSTGGVAQAAEAFLSEADHEQLAHKLFGLRAALTSVPPADAPLQAAREHAMRLI